jgi:hypothetical protein
MKILFILGILALVGLLFWITDYPLRREERRGEERRGEGRRGLPVDRITSKCSQVKGIFYVSFSVRSSNS